MAVNLAVHKRTTNEIVQLLEKKPEIEINCLPNIDEGFDFTIKTNNVKVEFVSSLFTIPATKKNKNEGEPYPLLLTKDSCEIAKKFILVAVCAVQAFYVNGHLPAKIEDLLEEIIKNVAIVNSYYHEHCFSLEVLMVVGRAEKLVNHHYRLKFVE